MEKFFHAVNSSSKVVLIDQHCFMKGRSQSNPFSLTSTIQCTQSEASRRENKSMLRIAFSMRSLRISYQQQTTTRFIRKHSQNNSMSKKTHF